MRIALILLSMVCTVAIVNAAPKTHETNRSAKITPRQLTDYMVANGDESTEKVAGRDSSPMLGLPDDVDSVPIKGDSTDDNEIGSDTTSTCEIVVDRSGNGSKPVCMLIVYERTHRASHKLESSIFRFTTDGKLERAVSIDGKVDDDGKAVPGTGSTRALDVKAVEVKKRATDQLALWLNRTAKKLAEKKNKTAATK